MLEDEQVSMSMLASEFLVGHGRDARDWNGF